LVHNAIQRSATINNILFNPRRDNAILPEQFFRECIVIIAHTISPSNAVSSVMTQRVKRQPRRQPTVGTSVSLLELAGFRAATP
jgi:hypothetical protein